MPIPSSPVHSRNSSTVSSVGSVRSASDHDSGISTSSSLDTPRTSISGSNPKAVLEPPLLGQADSLKLAYEDFAPFIETEELSALGYREIWYRVAVNQVAAYTLPLVLYDILPENSINQLILAHHRQVTAEGQLRDLRRPKQDELLAKQYLVLDRMLERAQTEAKILEPLHAMRWQGDNSASAKSRSSWMESPESASRSEGYNYYSENILGRRLDTILVHVLLCLTTKFPPLLAVRSPQTQRPSQKVLRFLVPHVASNTKALNLFANAIDEVSLWRVFVGKSQQVGLLEDPGSLVQIGFSAGVRSTPKFDRVRNITNRKLPTHIIDGMDHQSSSVFALFLESLPQLSYRGSDDKFVFKLKGPLLLAFADKITHAPLISSTNPINMQYHG
ncbi:uncharacterized protein LACBIDRAFT_331061 [Laccaria bicolor S238N-H82]|uniref:Predicted protein n=1 Tax=Laccaria bicolor (strain S238N-H82 / ATCC MYA-4686) TaxID=486041 RepID=B0DNB3_LACBS|nr:uncharacterized protein LACBIDRAFT_331061 [Laccaria bicolor S238N-H82]EDR03912.1 predicted protein [Laccaria bicolor S238N-H82]|eukprot:XP_001885480.1 predicted protein [Laccaria bicolor S238N-H82]